MCGSFLNSINLVLLGSLNRANACAGAALDALVCVDFVLAVAFLNAADRTFVRASTASDALVTDLVCHFQITPPSKMFT